jgi:hypothetical protein
VLVRAKVTLPNGEALEITASAEEIARLAALPDHRVEVLPDHEAGAGEWLHHDLRQVPRGKA